MFRLELRTTFSCCMIFGFSDEVTELMKYRVTFSVIVVYLCDLANWWQEFVCFSTADDFMVLRIMSKAFTRIVNFCNVFCLRNCALIFLDYTEMSSCIQRVFNSHSTVGQFKSQFHKIYASYTIILVFYVYRAVTRHCYSTACFTDYFILL